MATTTIDGLVTGLDTTKIIEGLTAVFQKRIDLLKSRKDHVIEQQTAFKSIQARLLALQSAVNRLGRSQNSVFDTKSVKSSNEDLAVAAASSSAAPGVHSFRINSLATSHQIASQGFDGPNSVITQGNLQIRVGSGATAVITIDSTNNTLQGLADAINNASTDVVATVIDDGSNGLADHRLLLTAKKTGAANTINVVNNLAADNGGAVRVSINESTVGPATLGPGWSGTSPVSSGGSYNGSDDDTYTFTVATGGTVGVDTLQLNYSDGSGTNTGQITINPADLDAFLTVAEGLQLKFGSGSLVAGETFTVDVSQTPAPVQAAANSSIILGSGSGAITIQNETNKIDNLIKGATINLLAADPTKTVQLTVEADTEEAKKAVLEFVDASNDLMEFIDNQVHFDSETKSSGVLLGNRSATVIQDEVRLSASGAIAGVNTLMNRLGALGITINNDGRFEVNQSKLDDALAGNISGVTLEDVRRLFALSGLSTHGSIQFVTGSVRTKDSTTPYQVDISQAAERASITATTALNASTVIDGTNNTISLVIDGRSSGTLTLPDGTYTQAAIAQELQAQINNKNGLSGHHVAISVDGGKLVVASESYGQASQVTIENGSALAALGFAGSESDRGQDVVGKFIFNGVDEPAVGAGQFLMGSATNPNTADLQVRVTFTASQIIDGPEASLTVTRGVASRLDSVLTRLLDPVNGRTKTINDGFQDQVDDINESITRQNELLKSKQQSLLRQFVAMETLVSQLKTTGDYLSAHLAATLNTQSSRK
jgi:flagellar capping protein FliD